MKPAVSSRSSRWQPSLAPQPWRCLRTGLADLKGCLWDVVLQGFAVRHSQASTDIPQSPLLVACSGDVGGTSVSRKLCLEQQLFEGFGGHKEDPLHSASTCLRLTCSCPEPPPGGILRSQDVVDLRLAFPAGHSAPSCQ